MRKLLVIIGALFWFVALAGVASAQILTNGGFENGLNGWTTATNNSIYTNFYTTPGLNNYSPVEGQYFGVLEHSSNSVNIDSSFSQTVTLTADQVLLGYAALQIGPVVGVSYGRVEILQNTGSSQITVATPWIFQTGEADIGKDSGWQFWSWAPPQAGTYILSLEFHSGVIESPAFAFFDANSVGLVEPPVPIPGSLLLLGSGLLGLAGAEWRHRRRS